MGEPARTPSGAGDPQTLESSLRAIRSAAIVLLLLAALGCEPEPALIVTTAAPPSTPAPEPTAVSFTPEQVRYLQAQAEAEQDRRDFLSAVAAARASVPHQLRTIGWCEAGRYLGLPFPATNYAELDDTGRRSTASGGYQALDGTWRSWVAAYAPHLQGVYPRAGLAPDFVQDAVVTAAYHDLGTTPWEASRGCWARR